MLESTAHETSRKEWDKVIYSQPKSFISLGKKQQD